jgi:ribosomal protein S18 acetylase RimI-like enzyme
MRLRDATADDIGRIAALHAESWRRTYRGMYSDHYLDHEVDADLLARWTGNLSTANASTSTVVAEDGDELAGFVHTVLHDHPDWGALLDNLHVDPDRKRSGLGTVLMAASARAVLAARPITPVYLWVLQANTAAQRFYDARGGMCAATEPWTAPDGTPIVSLRYTWPDPTTLLA